MSGNIAQYDKVFFFLCVCGCVCVCVSSEVTGKFTIASKAPVAIVTLVSL